ncbi:phosphatidylinositol 3- and 4-kinase, putative [Cordyceps militaris CM01]|uniref:Serine/threonine-protein kinase MEC1 n=1 Tax=Cordyceps militaris (strain CM01) TaxID=983644 RepID=G3JAP5_CORMM|nr:phosphatidylinositol 3- and 4-kinase, putative [Cordyceps militaris CM01]EGX95160.1 phosphatidylinositol 3- and 4-kinase, putative [Cordyceps militaris CM01]
MAGLPDVGGHGTGPPPSTLAAQLVETISASSKSAAARSDDHAELKGLFSEIQRVKDRPALLQTPAQRTEHNHMLVYVYCRVVLDALRLDDDAALFDGARARAEAFKALTFLRFTINETPGVLCFASATHGLLFRGPEPLWAWLLPRWLRLLGHPRCAELESAMEGFLQYLLLTVTRVSKLWPVIGPLMVYLRGCLTGLVEKLQSPPSSSSKTNEAMTIEMPPVHVLDQVLGGPSATASVSLTYRIKLPQALQQAHSLARVLAYPLVCPDAAFAAIAPMSETGLWLLDAWLDLWSAQKRLDSGEKKSPLPLINMAVDVAKAANGDHAVATATRNKACTTLVLLCSEMAAAPDELAEADDAGGASRASYCLALVAIAQAALQSPTIGRLAASKLVNELSLLPSQYPVLGEETDIWRCALLLREVANLEEPKMLPCSTHPSLFQDIELRRSVESMHLLHEQPTGQGNAIKRRKLNARENDAPSQALHGLYAALELDAPADETVLEPAYILNAMETLNDGSSSIRELRIAAGRVIVVFMPLKETSYIDDSLLSRNRKLTIGLLRQCSDRDPAHFVESRIMVWGQLGRVMPENELNLVLIKLLDYLGSSNSFEAAVAFNELLNLADSRSTTPRRLLEPYWKSLAYMATKDMVRGPQRSRAIAELLQISVNDLLLLIQTHALPWLVLDKRTEVIQKFAEARQDSLGWEPLMDNANMAAILSLLMIQETDDIETFVKSRLNDVGLHLPDRRIVDLLQIEPVLIAIELLKAAGQADGARKETITEALRWMATSILTANPDTKKLKKGNVIGKFLQSHILGLMARLTDVINDPAMMHPGEMEQRNCIRALDEMIILCQSHARIARPQISACLLAALAQDSLRDSSLSCWASMLENFEEEDVEALLETTFFIVKHYWPSFSISSMDTATTIVSFLLENHEAIVEKNISSLPSFQGIPALSKLEAQLRALRPKLLPEELLPIYATRLRHENSGVVQQALNELVPYLRANQSALYASNVAQADSVVTTLMRALLDCACRYNNLHGSISRLCVEAMGLIGCLDSNRVETVREQRSIVILNNFENTQETTDFALFLLEEILVPAFLSATDTRLQGFLCFAMQELLDRFDIKFAIASQNTGDVAGNNIYRKWLALPENVREVVTPFLTSKYMVAPMLPVKVEYPIFSPAKPYGNWLRSFVIELLRNGQTPYADMLFEPLSRVIRVKDLSTAEFLLPYLVLHVLLGSTSTNQDKDQILHELTSILEHSPAEDASYAEKEEFKRYCHAVFRVLDYAMRWVHGKKSSGKLSSEKKEQVANIQAILDSISAELISQRATDCNEYARALFHLEQHVQKLEQQKREPGDRNRMLERLQDIYANIDEPDGLEGISAHLHALDINQQILGHKKAGRWAAAQTWYEIQLAEKPDNVDVQVELLSCLKHAGQHDVLLNHVESMLTDSSSDTKIMPYAVEAAWVTGRWESLGKFIERFQGDPSQDFNMSLASVLSSLYKKTDRVSLARTVQGMREKIASAMTTSATASLQAAHDSLLKCHVLSDLEVIINLKPDREEDRKQALSLLDNRLDIIGAYFHDKQYILGIRRAAMELARPTFSDLDISALWLTSARLARKTDATRQSFNAVLHASQLGDDSATIENAKLLWKDSHRRQAIQMLQGAIERNRFMTQTGASMTASSSKLGPQQKLLTARAQLLLAKWLDTSGQTHASALREKYQQPPKTHSMWEKGHYYLGRHYKKILEAEQPLKADDQSDNYVTGEIARLVIENYLRSLNFGTKYLYQTLPRILTLWLDLGAQIDKAPDGKMSLSRELHKRRVEQLNVLHSFLDKYIKRLPAYIFYSALPQIVARIAHHNASVFERLTHIIVKVVQSYPQQALWSVIGAITTKQAGERKTRGMQILQMLRSTSRRVEGSSYDLKQLLRYAEKLAEQLLLACTNGDFQGNKTVNASLTRDLRFNHKCTPCPLVVPVEGTLTAALPTASEYYTTHRPFSRDVVTIQCFLDDVLVLSSLAKPRRLTARGSDGKTYMLLIKPKDDLRTDQRLMEFNGLINRSLKRDAESSRRQLYIRTYAVVPLNEECGIIEWVPGIKTMRDTLLSLYSAQKIHPDYMALKQLMDEASASESKLRIFTDDVLGRFPPLLPLWFVQQFPNPSAWFAARLRYTRSCAVMSMVGTILGLGDRHGENVNLEEGNGGIFHVDFNCLFDKGLTFAKPERVPFRLTHNMVAAMGIHGYEGPFRTSSELTLRILRQQEETLMTILEAFIYDPTLDLQKEKRPRKSDAAAAAAAGVRLHPQSVVDSIKRKVKGLLPNESIPLSVEGQVEELIKQAVDPRNLTAITSTGLGLYTPLSVRGSSATRFNIVCMTKPASVQPDVCDLGKGPDTGETSRTGGAVPCRRRR